MIFFLLKDVNTDQIKSKMEDRGEIADQKDYIKERGGARGEGYIAPNMVCKSIQTVSNCFRDPREIDKGVGGGVRENSWARRKIGRIKEGRRRKIVREEEETGERKKSAKRRNKKTMGRIRGEGK
jgi:hypothetical protein